MGMREGLLGGRWLVRALLAVMLAPAVAAYAIMARYAVDVPFIDDYPTVIGFAVKYEALPSAGARLHYVLADQYIEYKLVFVHVLTAVELGVTHHASVSFLFWIGNLLLLPLLWLIWRMFGSAGALAGGSPARRLLVFLPAVFYLFSLNYWEALDWAATGLGYLGTIFFCLLAIYLLADGERSWWRDGGACGAALVACTIAANAFLLGPIGLWMYWRRRAWGWAAAWCAVFALALVPYWIHLTRVPRSGKGSAAAIPLFFLSFVGAGSLLVRLAVPTGVLVVGLFCWAVASGFFRRHRAAVLAAGWLLASSALAAVGRGRTGIEFSTAPRYKIYSDLLLIFCYGFAAERVSALGARTRRVLLAGVVVVTGLFCGASERRAARELRTRRAMLMAGVDHYRRAPAVNSPMWFDVVEHDAFFAKEEVQAREEVTTAEREGLYTPPKD